MVENNNSFSNKLTHFYIHSTNIQMKYVLWDLILHLWTICVLLLKLRDKINKAALGSEVSIN